VHSPFWGQKPVTVLHRGCVKLSAAVFGQEKDMAKKLPWKLLFPPETNFGTSPHPTAHRQKVESGTICFYAQHHGLTPFAKDPRLMFICAPLELGFSAPDFSTAPTVVAVRRGKF
jgi:hypothetical protein